MFVLVVALLCLSSVLSLECAGRADGTYEIGCKSYGTCTGGVVKIIDCPTSQVYNNATQACDDPNNVSGICGQILSCTGKADGKYADTSNHCKSYFTCYKGQFLGHNICSATTVFDKSKETCNWPSAVPPPCGTLSPSASPGP